MKRRFAVLLIICILMVVLLNKDNYAGLTKSGTRAAQFLKIEIGARAIGMGGAYVALANDVSSIYWNPAGLIHIQPRGGAGFVHTNWLADTNFDFVAAVIKTGNFGAVSLSYVSLSMPDMEVRSEFEPEGTGEYFSSMDMSLGLSYAQKLTDRFSMGITAKYIRQQIWHMVASTIAFDIGLLFKTDFDWLTLGVSISNFGPKIQYNGNDAFVYYDYNPNQFGNSETIYANLQTDKWDLPLLFRFGIGMQILNQELSQLVLAVEARHPNDNNENLSFGLEYGIKRRFFLRGGYQALFEDQSEKGFTLGTGFKFFVTETTPFSIDYAYADWGRLNNVHRFSLEIQF